jgi:hypothetical protein
MFKPPRWAWPPLQRVNLTQFKQMVEQIAPKTQVFIPERFQTYDIRQCTRVPTTSAGERALIT